MKRPSLLDYLIGNLVSALVLTIAAITLGIAAYADQVSWLAAIGGLVFAGWGWGANKRLSAYRDWKREWDAMSGVPERAGSPRKAGLLRVASGLIAWAIMAYVALDQAKQPEMQLPVLLFWAVSALLVIGSLYRLLRRGSAPAARNPVARDAPVSLCIAVPARSPSVSEAMQDLPSHCLRVLSG